MNNINASVKFSADEACAWCAVVMRRNSTRNSQTLCLECYFRMLLKNGQADKVRPVSVLSIEAKTARAAGGSST